LAVSSRTASTASFWG